MSKRWLDQRWPWLLAAVVIIGVFLSSVVQIDLPIEDPRPTGSAEDIAALAERENLNVLFILIDTLRADRLGTYGYERDTSPTLDSVAAKGLRFDRHLSQSSWTKCSMASLWTGTYPAHNGVTRFNDVLSEEALMPAEIFKAAGYRTAGIYRNGWVSSNFGFSQGFDAYLRPSSRRIPPEVRMKNPTIKSRGTDEDTVASAMEFLRVSSPDQPWLLYLHFMDVHEYLYDEETAVFGSTHSDIYDNAILWTDNVLAVLWAKLIELGHAENTLVVISSDHGEAFLERGHEGHARNVYPEVTEVPFILSFPFKLDPGVSVSARTRNVDVWPTILDLVGLEVPTGIDGRSLRPQILAAARGEAAPETDQTGIAHLDQDWGRRGQRPRPQIAIADGAFRYIRTTTPAGEDVEQLFDASRDPRELEDRTEEEPEVLERLRQMAQSYLSSQPSWETPKREMDEMELNQLRALGYAVP